MYNQLEQLVRRGDVAYDRLGNSWTDGLLTGNGSIASLLSGARDMEWVVNHNEVYQAFSIEADFVPHSEINRLFDAGIEKDSHFMSKLERSKNPLKKPFHSVTPAILRLRSYNFFGWNIPPLPTLSGRVSIYDGTVHAHMEDNEHPADIFSFTPYGTNCFCIRLRNFSRWGHTWELSRPEDYALDMPSFEIDGDEVAFTQKFEREDETYAVVLKLVSSTGNPVHIIQQEGTFAGVSTEGSVDAFMVIRTSRRGGDPLELARAEARELAEKGLDALYKDHAAWWKKYWEKSFIHLDTMPELEKRVLFAQYTLACTFSKAPMASLSGMAYGPLNGYFPGCHAPWYTLDQNVQIAMMCAMPFNHAEIVDAMADTYFDCIDQLKAETRRLFGCDGICLPLNMLPDGNSSHGGDYRYTLCGSAYSGMLFVMAWRYSRNKEQLREKLYPLLKEFIRFHLGIMRRDEAGTYHLDWMIPPEIFTMTRDDTCSLSMLRPCVEVAIEASELFDEDHEEAKLWRDLLDHYPTLSKRSDGGWWCGPDIPEDHYMYGGHLFYPFFPSEFDTDEETARRTLDYAYNKGVDRDKLGNPRHGWTAFNTAATSLRLGGAEEFHHITDFVWLFAKENGLFYHNSIDFKKLPRVNPETKRLIGPVIEGTSVVLFLTAEALLQNRNGVVTLFPNMPSDFTGGFKSLLANGGFEVSAEMAGGKVVSCSVRALEKTTLRIRHPETNDILSIPLETNETCHPFG